MYMCRCTHIHGTKKWWKHWSQTVQPTDWNLAWRWCGHTYQVSRKSPCYENFFSWNGSFSGVGHIWCWIQWLTSDFTKVIWKDGRKFLPTVHFRTNALGCKKTFTALTSFSKLSKSFKFWLFTDIIRLQITMVWVFFSRFTSFEMCWKWELCWSAGCAYWHWACI